MSLRGVASLLFWRRRAGIVFVGFHAPYGLRPGCVFFVLHCGSVKAMLQCLICTLRYPVFVPGLNLQTLRRVHGDLLHVILCDRYVDCKDTLPPH